MCRTASFAVGALACAAAAGCGSSGEESLSKAELIEQSDAICKKGDGKIQAAGEKLFASGEPGEAALRKFVLDTVVPVTRQEITDIDALKPPEEENEQVQEIVDSANEGLSKIRDNPGLAAEDGADDPLAEASKLAKAYGMKECGNDE